MKPHSSVGMIAATLLLGCSWSGSTAEVDVIRVPNAGIQPQALTDSRGTTHLLYYKGPAGGGDLYYIRQTNGQSVWTAPVRVNSTPGSAIATGSIRGGQLAVGRDGWIHVVWNGSQRAANHRGVPFYYTRLDSAQSAFEPQRDLVNYAVGLDGGGSVTADAKGRVYVFWHGVGKGDTDSEDDRRVFLAQSADDGRTFARENPVSPDGAGVCACCGLRGLVNDRGQLWILYRAVDQVTNRNSTLIWSKDGGQTFVEAHSHPWTVSTCPMSSSWLQASATGTLLAWESAGRVHAGIFDESSAQVRDLYAPPGRTNKKHPVLVANVQGRRLLVWTEGTGWQRGGALVWQVLDRDNRPMTAPERRDGIPVWSFAAAIPRLDGSFLVLY